MPKKLLTARIAFFYLLSVLLKNQEKGRRVEDY